MCWHLFTLGTSVTVATPDELRGALAEMAGVVVRHHGSTPQV